MRRIVALAAIVALLGCAAARAEPSAKTIYLDKLDKGLDDWWNALDGVCRGEPGDSEASNLACDQRLEVDKLIKKRGCWNIYPVRVRTTRPIGFANATSYPGFYEPPARRGRQCSMSGSPLSNTPCQICFATYSSSNSPGMGETSPSKTAVISGRWRHFTT
jgi:hypothetical protein